ncbi:MAG: alkaline phosphatase [Planctomycetes bacterium]|nr:alkaline phosphatase [Planctomycetota bacterium]
MQSRTRTSTLVILLLGMSTAFAETPQEWYRQGQRAVQEAKKLKPITGRAKNVILMIGDGMGISTVTAARILEGQLRGMPGEENLLSFEKMPYTALIKTYTTNEQVSDSAGTMSAIVTGVKTKSGVISVDQEIDVGDFASTAAHSPATIFELAERAGRSTGIVSTTRITHATPAACYAHSPHRAWEDDSRMPRGAAGAGFPDIARQLIEFSYGDGLDIVLGGGRRHFLPNTVKDPENPKLTGWRKDKRNLVAEWSARPGARYIWNKRQFDQLEVNGKGQVLGLFSWSNMAYEHDRPTDTAGEPSLSEMTAKAIEFLARKNTGYLLMVEGGRIDHAHHDANAYRALTDTIEFAGAVRVALSKTDRRDTLVIVTADHSHVFTMGGHPVRGNPIFGKVVENDRRGHAKSVPAVDGLGLPFTTLGYANGPGYTGRAPGQPEGPKRLPPPRKGYEGITKGRPDLTHVDTGHHSYLFECAVPMAYESHGGEDVPLYADGPHAYLFRGVMEQNVIFHVMVEAMGLETKP